VALYNADTGTTDRERIARKLGFAVRYAPAPGPAS
jgi:hypothetical protein